MRDAQQKTKDAEQAAKKAWKACSNMMFLLVSLPLLSSKPTCSKISVIIVWGIYIDCAVSFPFISHMVSLRNSAARDDLSLTLPISWTKFSMTYYSNYFFRRHCVATKISISHSSIALLDPTTCWNLLSEYLGSCVQSMLNSNMF